MSFTLVDYKYNGTSSNLYPLSVRVYNDVNTPDKYWDEAFESVKDALDQAYTNTSLSRTEVEKIDTDADIDPSSHKTDGENWLSNNNIYSNGVHLFVFGGHSSSFVAHAYGGNPWQNQRTAFVNAPNSANDSVFEIGVRGIHEGLHSFINENCNEVINQTLGGGTPNFSGDDDHAMGEQIYKNGQWRSTPMLGQYGKDQAEAGDCDTWVSDGYVTKELSQCTLEALPLSREHHVVGH